MNIRTDSASSPDPAWLHQPRHGTGRCRTAPRRSSLLINAPGQNQPLGQLVNRTRAAKNRRDHRRSRRERCPTSRQQGLRPIRDAPTGINTMSTTLPPQRSTCPRWVHDANTAAGLQPLPPTTILTVPPVKSISAEANPEKQTQDVPDESYRPERHPPPTRQLPNIKHPTPP